MVEWELVTNGGFMKNLKVLLKKYNTAKAKSKFITAYDSIDATKKWVEYSLDVAELKVMTRNSDFLTRFDIEKAIIKAETKVDWMYKHPNFDRSEATVLYKKLKRLLNF